MQFWPRIAAVNRPAADRADSQDPPPAAGARSGRAGLLPLVAVLAVGVAGPGDGLAPRTLARDPGPASRRDRRLSSPAPRLAAVAVFVGLYVVVVALSLPGGADPDGVGRHPVRRPGRRAAPRWSARPSARTMHLPDREDRVRRAPGRGAPGRSAARLAEGFREDAFSYLLFLRLVPVFPFFLVNLVAGAGGRAAFDRSSRRPLIGIIPATFAFAFVGAGLDSVIAAQEAAYRACLAAGRAGLPARFRSAQAAITPELMAALGGARRRRAASRSR